MGYLLPALSGALLALVFCFRVPGFVSWAALAPLMYYVRANAAPAPRSAHARPLHRPRAFCAGLAAGFVFNFFAMHWVTNSMSHYGGLPYPVSLVVLAALSLYLALYFGAFAWALSRLGEGPAAYLFAPAVWVALELARDHLLSGFPWNLLGYAVHDSLRVIQVADMTGVYGVSALVVLINLAVSDIIALSAKRARPAFGKLAGPAAALAVLALVVVYGQARLGAALPEEGRLKVALVQGDIDQSIKWEPEHQQDVMDKYVRMTLDAARSGPGLIVWPETATPFYWQDTLLRAGLTGLARQAGTYILTGSPSFEKTGEESFTDYNSAYLVGPGGETVGRYDKVHLVPFGEYVPLKSVLFFVEKAVTSIADFGSGEEYTVLDAGGAHFGTMICFEVIFPEIARRFTAGGAEFLVTITNDAWFGKSAAPYQHFNMAVFRAVENRRALVRAANTGISGIVMPDGTVSAKTGIFTDAVVTGEIPLVTATSFYARHGDLFAYACAILSAFCLLYMVKPGRRRDDGA